MENKRLSCPYFLLISRECAFMCVRAFSPDRFLLTSWYYGSFSHGILFLLESFFREFFLFLFCFLRRNLCSWIPFSAFPVVFKYDVLILLFDDSLHHEVEKYLSCLDIICSVSSISNHQLIYLRIFTDNEECVM